MCVFIIWINLVSTFYDKRCTHSFKQPTLRRQGDMPNDSIYYATLTSSIYESVHWIFRMTSWPSFNLHPFYTRINWALEGFSWLLTNPGSPTVLRGVVFYGTLDWALISPSLLVSQVTWYTLLQMWKDQFLFL